MKKGEVWYGDRLAGYVAQTDEGYSFQYTREYLQLADSRPVSLTLPLASDAFISKTLFPFFDGLIPEGWLLDIAQENWKINRGDRMELLLTCCQDCIGAVSIIRVGEKSDT